MTKLRDAMLKKMSEFLNKVDQLCFEYGYEIKPTILRHDEKGKAIQGLIIEAEHYCAKVLYIDGDGGFNVSLPDKEGEL